NSSKPTKQGDQNKVLRCPVCGRTFQYRAKLTWHQKSHTNYRAFQCSLCSNAYKYEANLRGHMKAKHSSESTRPLRTSREKVQESNEAGNPCSECNKFFKSWKYLQQHQQSVHKGASGAICEKCGVSFSQKHSLHRHVRTVHEQLNRVTCAQCGKSFRSSFDLNRHIKIVHKAASNFEVHQCPVCGKTFRYRGSLMGHQKSHTNHHDFQCSLCSNAYKYTSDLYGHMRAKHAAEITGTYRTSSETVQKSREAGNPCFECNKFFKSWRCLQQHQQLVHKGAGRSLCEECGNIFSQKKILYRHIRNVHKKP
ncbi:zinc finger protein 629, partial [Clonorchis sinensis]